MASLYSKRGIIYLQWYEGGKKFSRSLKLKDTKRNRIIANKFLREKEFELSRPKRIKAYHTLREVIRLFLQTKKDKAKSTYDMYDIVLSYLVDFLGDIYVSEITPDVGDGFLDYLNAKELRHNSKAAYFRHLHSFFNWLIENDYYIGKNPIKRIKAQDMPITVIPQHHEELILANLRGEQYRIIKFLFLTGFRISEALQLHWGDIDWDDNIILVNNIKGKRIDYFPLYPKLKEFLLSFYHNQPASDKVFVYSNRTSMKFFRRTLNKLNLPPYTIHSIRKTFASRYAEKLTAKETREILRHRDIRTTLKYYVKVDLQAIGDKLG